MARPRIGSFSRIAAGGLGVFILGAGLLVAGLMIREGVYFWALIPVVIGGAGSAVFLHAAWVGTSPRWEDLPE